MFSGIVERVGDVERADRSPAGLGFAIRHGFARALEPGASVAVNGVCLTVERSDGGRFEAVAVEETLGKTTLGSLRAGARVNLERALRMGDVLGGHWVQGHVDSVATIRSVRPEPSETRVEIEIPEPLRRYVAEKGSVAVDGISLTVARLRDPILVVALVPYTLKQTIADGYRSGTRVNLEVDIVARYLERLLEARGLSHEAAPGSPAAGRSR